MAAIRGKASGMVHSMIEAELSAGLGVGGDSAWVVVGHASDQPRSDPRQGVLFQAFPGDLEGTVAARSDNPLCGILMAARGASSPMSARNTLPTGDN